MLLVLVGVWSRAGAASRKIGIPQAKKLPRSVERQLCAGIAAHSRTLDCGLLLMSAPTGFLNSCEIMEFTLSILLPNKLKRTGETGRNAP